MSSPASPVRLPLLPGVAFLALPTPAVASDAEFFEREVRSLKSDHSNHYEATLMMHTGSVSFARPSVGSWVSYGLGTVNCNLPSFLVLAPQAPYAGDQTWGADFLPGCHQGTRVVPGPTPIADVRRRNAVPPLSVPAGTPDSAYCMAGLPRRR